MRCLPVAGTLRARDRTRSHVATGSGRERNRRVTKRIPVVLLTVLCVALLAACTELPPLLRRHTYPPNFKYIDRTQLSSAMWQLADDVSALDRVMRQPGPIDAARRADVERLLTAMLAATSALQAQGRPTNHPLMSDHVEGFRRDVTQALAAVRADPPNYYLVGTVSGTCLTCHSPE